MVCKWTEVRYPGVPVMHMKLFVLTQALLIFALASASAAAAPTFKDRMEAQKLAQEAKQLSRQGKHKQAAKNYKKADKLMPAPSYKLEMAKELLELEDLVQANEVLLECMDQGPIRQWAEKAAQKKCIELASKVDDRLPRIAVVVIEPSSEEVIIMIDGEDYDPSDGEIGFNPGKHEITAEAEGFANFKKKVTLKEGDRETVEITLKGRKKEPEKEEEADDEGGGLSPIPAYIGWGLGAVGLGVGIGFGIAAITSTNDVLTLYGCENGVCPPEAEADLDVAKLNGNLSTAGFIVGGVGIAGGTILYLLADTDGDDESEESEDEDEGMLKIEARPMIGPGYVGVSGTF